MDFGVLKNLHLFTSFASYRLLLQIASIKRISNFTAMFNFNSITMSRTTFSILFFIKRTKTNNSVTYWFSLRESQEVGNVDVNTTVLSSDLVLLTSIGYWDVSFISGGQIVDSKSLVSLLWKKEPSGWKVIYLQESFKID